MYLTPHNPSSVIDAHIVSIVQIMLDYKLQFVLLCGDYNLSNLTLSSINLRLSASGNYSSISSSIINSFSFFNFFQLTSHSKKHGSILDLIFSNCNNTSVNLSLDLIVTPDPYLPPLHISFLFQTTTYTNNTHTYKDFKGADYTVISQIFNSFNWEAGHLLSLLYQRCSLHF